ncbi:DUF1127 domain-containing protein [Pararhizobium mangrovi]|uniref:DUF1127 domain-containing protein n=1 Tax=Pararhizobium mangrovi TaxID=2590452 RepID=A0A506U328_9HYPH|nr:DUF1127 domain-containing protein [Pararhizobium mangrovi]TPW27395.1 DUF1127 domain-containing protein [Pararhizobium mangrovi]
MSVFGRHSSTLSVFLRASEGWRSLRSDVASILRARRNRRSVRRLETFDDHELADIGLRRDDLRAALAMGPLGDPSDHLVEAARRRRVRIRRA